MFILLLELLLSGPNQASLYPGEDKGTCLRIGLGYQGMILVKSNCALRTAQKLLLNN